MYHSHALKRHHRPYNNIKPNTVEHDLESVPVRRRSQCVLWSLMFRIFDHVLTDLLVFVFGVRSFVQHRIIVIRIRRRPRSVSRGPPGVPTPSRAAPNNERICIITGATQGLGREAALSLGRCSPFSHVILACRDVMAAKALAREDGMNGRLIVLEEPFDLSSGASVQRFSSAVKTWLSGRSVSSIVLNAGVPASLGGAVLTVDGYEQAFATNHLGHFAFILLLAPALALGGTATTPARVVVVASDAHDAASMTGCPDPSIGWPPPHAPQIVWDATLMSGGESYTAPYNGALRYSRSKLANVLFARELAKRAPGVRVSAFNPGILLDTAFVGNLFGAWVAAFVYFLIPLLLLTPLGRIMRTAPQAGAALAAVAAGGVNSLLPTMPLHDGGAIYYDVAPEGGARVVKVSEFAESAVGNEAAGALWTHSARWLVPSHATRADILAADKAFAACKLFSISSPTAKTSANPQL